MTGYGSGPLSARFTLASLRGHLSDWQPYPTIDDREAWQAVPQDVANGLLVDGERARTAEWPTLSAHLYRDYSLTANRERYETPYFARRDQLNAMVAAAGITGEVDEVLLDRLWSVCEESSWCLPAHDPRPLPDPATPVPDLFAAQTAAQVALAMAVLRPALDRISPTIAPRLAAEVDHRVLTPYGASDEFWWFGTVQPKINNWNPWINTNVLIAGLLTLDDPERRAALARRVATSLDAYLACLPDDGGCTEGQGYWAVSASKLLDAVVILRDATSGALDTTDLPELVGAARYPVAMHIAGRHMVQHSDGPGLWSQDPQVLHRYGLTVGDDELRRLGLHLRDVERATGRASAEAAGAANLWDRLARVFDHDYHAAPPTPAPHPGVIWFPTIEVLSVRERPGTSDGLHLVAKGGHNLEEHNQNDVGSFSLARDGQPLVVDAGVNTYTGETFGPRRYEIWSMRSDWHNLPRINGVDQAAGRAFAATDVAVTGLEPDAVRTSFSAELAPAWPEGAGLTSWRRDLVLDREQHMVTLIDTWQLTTASSLTLGLVCAAEPQPEVSGGRTSVGSLVVTHPGLHATVEVLPIPAGDRLEPTWGRQLWRLLLTPETLATQGSWTISFR